MAPKCSPQKRCQKCVTDRKEIEKMEKKLVEKKQALEEQHRAHEVVDAQMSDVPAFSFPSSVEQFQPSSARRESCVTPLPEEIFGSTQNDSGEPTPNQNIPHTIVQSSIQTVRQEQANGWMPEVVDFSHQQALASTSHNGFHANVGQMIGHFPPQQPFPVQSHQFNQMMPNQYGELVQQQPSYPVSHFGNQMMIQNPGRAHPTQQSYAVSDYHYNQIQHVPSQYGESAVQQQPRNQGYRFNPMVRPVPNLRQQQQYYHPMLPQQMSSSTRGTFPSTSAGGDDDCVIIDPVFVSAAQKKKREERLAKRRLVNVRGDGWERIDGVTRCLTCKKPFANGSQARHHAKSAHREIPPANPTEQPEENQPGPSIKQEQLEY